MIITAGCPTCNHRYDIPGKLAGKRVRCKECANVFRVPVPSSVPIPSEPSRKSRKRKPKLGLEGEISDILETSDIEAPDTLTVVPSSRGLFPDPGEKRWYQFLPYLCLLVLVGLNWLGLISSLRAVTWSLSIIGVFLILPVLGGWESFEKSKMHQILSTIAGQEGAKAIRATLAVSCWVLAILIAMDTIHIAALQDTPQGATTPAAPGNTTSEPDAK